MTVAEPCISLTTNDDPGVPHVLNRLYISSFLRRTDTANGPTARVRNPWFPRKFNHGTKGTPKAVQKRALSPKVLAGVEVHSFRRPLCSVTLNLDRPVTASRSARTLELRRTETRRRRMAAQVFHSCQWLRRVRAGARKTREVIFAKSTAFQFAPIECPETLSRRKTG